MVGFLSPFAFSNNFGAGLTAPSVVAGSFAHAAFVTASSGARTYLSDYDEGAGSNRKVIAVFVCEDTAIGGGFDSCTWGGVEGIDAGNNKHDGAANDVDVQVFYWDEADFPAAGTNPVVADSVSNEHYAINMFTIQDAQPGAFRDDGGGSGTDTSPLDRSLTVTHSNSLILTLLGISDTIDDSAATGSGHSIADDYDAGGAAGEHVIIGKVDDVASGAHTLGYTFTDSAAAGRSVAVAPIGSYTPFGMTHPVSTQFGTSTTAHAVTMPATVDAGDLLVVGIGLFGGASNPAITTPSGWTQLSHSTNGTGRLGIYVKSADGTEDGGTVDFATDNAATGAALCYRIKTGNWSGTIGDCEAGTPATATNSNSVNPPAVAPSWATGGDRWLAIIFIMQKDDDVVMNSKPAGYYGKYTLVSGAGANAGASISSTWKQVDGTTDDPGVHGFNLQDDWVANTIAIRKAT